MEPVAATSKAQQGLWLFALAAFAAATVWINYEVKVKVQGGQGSGSVLEMGNVKVNQPAPDFSALDLSGNAVSLASFRGHKVVLLDFWATWCGPCRMAMVALQDLQDKYKNQGLEILSLNQAEPADNVRQFINRKKYGFHVLLDPQGDVSTKYGVRAIPTLVLIDKNGVIQRLQVGYSPNESDLQQTVERLLKK
ncbi:MAG: TlpA family protein disulfide reductase [Limisphaerales bacterium]